MEGRIADGGSVGCFPAAGNPIDHPIARRTINPTLEDLRAIPERILAAGGLQKVSVIRSAIRAGLVDVLITDDATASALLSF